MKMLKKNYHQQFMLEDAELMGKCLGYTGIVLVKVFLQKNLKKHKILLVLKQKEH